MKQCPKCRGSLYTRQGLDGLETNCMNCGYEPVSISTEVMADVHAALGKKSLRVAIPKFNVREQEDI